MSIMRAMRNLRALARRWLPGGRAMGARLGLAAAVLLAAPVAHAEFTNGGFEQDWTGWEAPVPLRRPSTDMGDPIAAPGTVFPPVTTSDLGLYFDAGYGSVSAVVGTLSDTNTSNMLKTPLFGDKSGRVGDAQTNNRGASVRQTATMGVGDIDPADGKVHIRLAIAPVLSDGGHPGPRQPFFFVEVINKTKGTQLFRTFNFAGETGVPWQKGVGDYKYTNWQAIDIGPGAGVLDVDDEVEVIISTAGCADGGHAGYLYVDSGQGLTTLPGPFVTATGPQFAVRSDVGADTPSGSPPAGQRTITYNYHYSNGGDAPMVNSEVVISSPQDQQTKTGTTINKYQQNLRLDPTSLPTGCTYISVPEPTPTNTRVDKSLGPIDVVTCNVGTLNPGNMDDLQLRWIVPSDAKEPTVNHGNYYIQSASSPALLGPLVRTNITNLVLADLKSTVTNPSSSLTCGSSTTYTVTLDNDGPGDAPANVQISNAVPAGLTVTGWSCSATGGTVACPAASGTGSIADTVTTAWPKGDKLIYTINANVDACPGSSRLITYPVGLTLPADPTVVDPDSSNNTHANVLNAGPALQPLTVDTAGNGGGTVTSVLPGIVCTKPDPATQCSDTKSFPAGSQVALYANAPAGSIFSNWSGGVCSGTVSPCFVTMSQARSVTANFSVPLDVAIGVTGPGGTATPGNGTTVPVAPGGTTSITVQPDAGYAPVFGGTCPAGSYVGNTYTTGAVTGNCTVDITFTNTGGVVTATPNSPSNGSIVGGPKTVAPGGSATWKVTPNSGYTPNLTPGGTCLAGTWNSDNTEYTVSPITVDCNVVFSFVPSYTVTGSVSGTSPGPGSITAGASQTLVSGSSAVFALSRPGTVDPASTCTGGSFDAAGTTYTVPNVTANCAMVFSFAALPSAASIPTLSEWGLIILSGLMGLFVVGMRRRRML